MATFNVTALDSVVFTDDPIGETTHSLSASDSMNINDVSDDVRVRVESTDELQVDDLAQVFNRYKVSCAESIIFSDDVGVITTPYIKWISDEVVFGDGAGVRADFRIRQGETVVFGDGAVCKLISRALASDGMSLSNESSNDIDWGTALVSDDSEVVFSDSCSMTLTRITLTNFTNALIANVGTTPTIMYTSPVDSTSTILNISLCNVSAGDITADVILYKGGVVPFDIRIHIPIAEGETYVINNTEEESINIEAGDEIRVTSSIASSLDVFLSVIEQTKG